MTHKYAKVPIVWKQGRDDIHRMYLGPVWVGYVRCESPYSWEVFNQLDFTTDVCLTLHEAKEVLESVYDTVSYGPLYGGRSEVYTVTRRAA